MKGDKNMELNSIKQQLINREHFMLAPYATFSDKSKGRDFEDDDCPIRTCFQRDRDRIIHSNAWQREKDKTQVITTAFLNEINKNNDKYRTRMTHSLEVAQIGRVIAESLRLNADLVEAAAYGHDLGHTPFGHTGEDALNRRYEFGFKHTNQSIRVVECIEKNGKGLNLTSEVREAIANHSGLVNDMEGVTLETKILPFADKIAYLTSDLDDAKTFGIIKMEEIPADVLKALGTRKSEIINTLMMGIINTSYGKPIVKMDDETFAYMSKLRNWMFDHVYHSDKLNESRTQVDGIINYICDYYELNPEKMDFISDPNNIQRSVCDYVASMTDHYALELYQNRRKILMVS